MPEKAIIDTSVLIALERISMSDVLCRIYSHIILPESVVSEFGRVVKMIYIQATVKGSSVKLPDAIKVSDGSRVIVTFLEPTTKIKDKLLSEELENEDIEFVRACLGRLAKQLQKGDD